ncbi:hypothetical protein EVAR_80382_1 [Eumeta japonica]|uniref:Uncharacterized protein n=1 Tax=Eumeta variegata TaxID=151549 RepID=A0A4C1VHY5_EUMVA|nr:hypothetical protein EVAR_80382_1 [Eumeta japonica]
MREVLRFAASERQGPLPRDEGAVVNDYEFKGPVPSAAVASTTCAVSSSCFKQKHGKKITDRETVGRSAVGASLSNWRHVSWSVTAASNSTPTALRRRGGRGASPEFAKKN